MKKKLKIHNPKEGKKGEKRKHRADKITKKYNSGIMTKYNSNC